MFFAFVFHIAVLLVYSFHCFSQTWYLFAFLNEMESTGFLELGLPTLLITWPCQKHSISTYPIWRLVSSILRGCPTLNAKSFARHRNGSKSSDTPLNGLLQWSKFNPFWRPSPRKWNWSRSAINDVRKLVLSSDLPLIIVYFIWYP